MRKYQFTHEVFTAYHLQTNCQAKLANREIKHILEKIANTSRKYWSSHLIDALWTYRTTFKSNLEKFPYRLVYGKACHFLVELEHMAYWAIRALNCSI